MALGDVRELREAGPKAAPCELLEWDTAFWGVPVARVAAETMTDDSRAEVDAWCIDNGISCLYFLARSDDPETIAAAERGGFFQTDTRVTLSRALGPERQEAPPAQIRPAQPSDLPTLKAIARVSHGTTRFYHDPHFPDDRCGELYAEWIQSSFESGATVLVVDEGGRAVGYITCWVEDGNRGYIGLLAVDPAARERGLGAALGNAALDWLAARGVTHSAVPTQARNVAAIGLIEQAGYAIEYTQLWFHKWYYR
jgi:GNAT superfamily N-acetyltransferase